MGGFQTEYAKSNRSTCKGCNKTIDKDELRIGKMVPSPHFDGDMPLWHHRKCLFKREVIMDVSLLSGLENLRPADVKSLKDEVAGKSNGLSVKGVTSAMLVDSSTADSFQVDYAKSGRSTCKHCAEKIDEGELRVGKMVASPSFDGKIPNWHHLNCIFKACVIFSITLIDGLDALRPEDAKELKKLVGKHTPAVGGAAAAADDDDEEMPASKPAASKSAPKKPAASKSGTKKKAATKSGGKRKKRYDSGDDETNSDVDSDGSASEEEESWDSPKKKKKKPAAKSGGGSKPKAAKTSAASTDYTKMTVAQLKELCKEHDLSTTGKKAELVERLEEKTGGATKDAADDDDVDMKDAADGDDTPAVAASASSSSSGSDSEKDKHDKAIEKEGTARWAIKDAVSSLSNSDIKELLAANDQPNTGGRDKLLDQLIDGLMYGKLPPCPDCKNQALTFVNGEYACHGKASEWARCIYTAADIKRTKFDVSSYDGNCTYITNFKFKAMVKPIEAHKFIANLKKKATDALTQAQSAAADAIKARQAELVKSQVLEELFNEFNIVVVGTKFANDMTSKQLKDLISKHGGEIATDIEDADLIITTPEEVEKNSKKMTEAMKEKKPILLATFITDSIEKVELRDPKDYSAVKDSTAFDLAGLSKKVESGRQKSGAKLAGATNGGAAASSSTKSGIGKSGGGAKAKLIIKGRGAVDDESGLAESSHILEEKDDVYTQTLSMTDLTTGTNSYYILQLIEGDKASRYHVFRKWGRTGSDRGSSKLTDHGSSKESAKAEFLEVYLDKTGNHWANHKNFVKKPGKFMVVDVDYSAGDDPFADDAAAAAASSASSSKLDKRVQDLMKIFFDVQQIKKTLMSMEIDLDKMPLGRLSRAHIQSGFDVLTELQDEIKQAAPSQSKLLGLSNKFFTLIPHEKSIIIQNEEQLKEKIEMIETLLEIEVATRMLKESKITEAEGKGKKDDEAPGKSNDPIDIHYRQLKTDFSVVEKKTSEFKLISDYITNTHAPTHKNYTLELMEAFSIDRHGEGDRYKTFEQNPNRMLLWHGSRTSNFVGILSQGLRIAPPEAPVTGYMFGKGVYFADMVSKSANYCFTNSTNNVGFLLLCEVALGDMNLLTHAQYMDKPPKGTLSTKGIGLTLPDPKGSVTLENGCVVPAGKPVKVQQATTLLYNEFIVYDVAQIRAKYLLKVKFNYQQRW